MGKLKMFTLNKSIYSLLILTALAFSSDIVHSQSADENNDELYSTALEMILRDQKSIENFEDSFCIPDSVVAKGLLFFNTDILNSLNYLSNFYEPSFLKETLKHNFLKVYFSYKMSDLIFKKWNDCTDKEYVMLFGPTNGIFLQVFVKSKESISSSGEFFSGQFDAYMFIFSDKRLIHFFKGTIVE